MRNNRSRLLFVVGSVAALLSLRAVSGSQGSGRDPATRALSIFSDVLSLTRSNYVEQVDNKALLEGAYDGMSDALDAFSYYVPASERPAYRAEQASGAVGPGIVVARRGGFPFVVGALPGSPAEKAGVRSGDLIDTIDGKNVRTAPVWKIRSALEGPEGTSVALLLFRAGEENRVSLRVPRARFEPPPVSARWDRDVGIVRVPAFTPTAARQLADVVAEAGKRSVSKLVIDVRGAIGGEVADAAAAASSFVGKGIVASVVSRRLAVAPVEASGEKLWNGRTVVLTDDATAGAAEIFAAALHDRAAATTVGETTVGMAVIQRQVQTASGGTLWMTVGRYVSPSGTVLGGKGLSPDERVLVLPGDGQADKDPILERGLEIARSPASARKAA
ncbi:MAG: S41 family peptidase [Acidobacteriota bacterium]